MTRAELQFSESRCFHDTQGPHELHRMHGPRPTRPQTGDGGTTGPATRPHTGAHTRAPRAAYGPIVPCTEKKRGRDLWFLREGRCKAAGHAAVGPASLPKCTEAKPVLSLTSSSLPGLVVTRGQEPVAFFGSPWVTPCGCIAPRTSLPPWAGCDAGARAGGPREGAGSL
jgi:hypothetical protein